MSRDKIFLNGQIYELTQLLAQAMTLEPFEITLYIEKRLSDMDKESKKIALLSKYCASTSCNCCDNKGRFK